MEYYILKEKINCSKCKRL